MSCSHCGCSICRGECSVSVEELGRDYETAQDSIRTPMVQSIPTLAEMPGVMAAKVRAEMPEHMTPSELAKEELHMTVSAVVYNHLIGAESVERAFDEIIAAHAAWLKA